MIRRPNLATVPAAAAHLRTRMVDLCGIEPGDDFIDGQVRVDHGNRHSDGTGGSALGETSARSYLRAFSGRSATNIGKTRRAVELGDQTRQAHWITQGSPIAGRLGW